MNFYRVRRFYGLNIISSQKKNELFSLQNLKEFVWSVWCVDRTGNYSENHQNHFYMFFKRVSYDFKAWFNFASTANETHSLNIFITAFFHSSYQMHSNIWYGHSPSNAPHSFEKNVTIFFWYFYPLSKLTRFKSTERKKRRNNEIQNKNEKNWKMNELKKTNGAVGAFHVQNKIENVENLIRMHTCNVMLMKYGPWILDGFRLRSVSQITRESILRWRGVRCATVCILRKCIVVGQLGWSIKLFIKFFSSIGNDSVLWFIPLM